LFSKIDLMSDTTSLVPSQKTFLQQP